jgi:protein-tyrosine-phosphatase
MFRMENLTPKQIMAMTEEEWQEYRNKSWERKRESYSKDIPDWYLKSQEEFAKFLERRQFKHR